MSENTDIIQEKLSKPDRVVSDGVEVQDRNLTTAMNVAQKLDAQTAMTKPHRGLYFNRLVGHGPTG